MPSFGANGRKTVYKLATNNQKIFGLYPTFLAMYVHTILLLITGNTVRAANINVPYAPLMLLATKRGDNSINTKITNVIMVRILDFSVLYNIWLLKNSRIIIIKVNGIMNVLKPYSVK